MSDVLKSFLGSEEIMIYDFLNSMQCVLSEENSDYHDILDSWKNRDYKVALMPAIFWYSGTYNLFDQKAGHDGENLIWIIPAGQSDFFWLPNIKEKIESFYQNDEIELGYKPQFPGIEAEDFEECILLNSEKIQNKSECSVLGANVILVRLSLSSGNDTLLFIVLDHQDNCWKNIIEYYNIKLTWFVDSGRGTEDYFTDIKLYQLMKQTSKPNLLPGLYFKGLYNSGAIPEGFQFLYAMLSKPDSDGYDIWRWCSAVYKTCW